MERAACKATLLQQVVTAEGGRRCSSERLAAIAAAISELEPLTTARAPTRSTLLLGRWNCVFTTSRDLLKSGAGGGGAGFVFDPPSGRAELQRGFPASTERARLSCPEPAPSAGGVPAEPLRGFRMTLEFDSVKMWGLLPLPALSRRRDYSDLEVVYLDLDMLVCRGWRGAGAGGGGGDGADGQGAGQQLHVFVQTDPLHRLEIPGGSALRTLPPN